MKKKDNSLFKMLIIAVIVVFVVLIIDAIEVYNREIPKRESCVGNYIIQNDELLSFYFCAIGDNRYFYLDGIRFEGELLDIRSSEKTEFIYSLWIRTDIDGWIYYTKDKQNNLVYINGVEK